MAVPDLVIALNEADQIIDVAPAEDILTHIAGHLPKVSPSPGDPSSPSDPAKGSGDHAIEFYASDGEELEVVVSKDWHQLTFAPSGRKTNLRELRSLVERILNARFTAIAEESRPPVVTMPSGGTFADFVESCAELVGGRQPQPQPQGPDPHDRRGWWHNTFVHGGKV